MSRAWIERVVRLETRLAVRLAAGPPVKIRADRDQLDQLLINLVNNAVDAALETGGGVAIGWEKQAGALELWVRDEGPGLADSGNLFVPFFTTKAARIGHRAGAEPADRRRPRRHGDAGKPHPRPRLRSARAAARLTLPAYSALSARMGSIPRCGSSPSKPRLPRFTQQQRRGGAGPRRHGLAEAIRCLRYVPRLAAPATPATTPAVMGSKLRRKRRRRTWSGDAPTAIRTPISCVRCAIE